MSSQGLQVTAPTPTSGDSTTLIATAANTIVRVIPVAAVTTGGLLVTTSLVNDPEVVALRKAYASVVLVGCTFSFWTRALVRQCNAHGNLRFGLVPSRTVGTNVATVERIPNVDIAVLSDVAFVTATNTKLPANANYEFGAIATGAGHPVAAMINLGYGAAQATTLAQGSLQLTFSCSGVGPGIDIQF